MNCPCAKGGQGGRNTCPTLLHFSSHLRKSTTTFHSNSISRLSPFSLAPPEQPPQPSSSALARQSSIIRMRLLSFSRTAWSLMASLACLGALADVVEPVGIASVLEVELVFPRNETYAPTPWMPVVFALRNAELARHLNPFISYDSYSTPLTPNGSWIDRSKSPGSTHTVRWLNLSDHEPYFVYKFHNFATEGTWNLSWTVSWQSCDAHDFGAHRPGAFNSSASSVAFTIRDDGPPVDLVAATANDKTCSEEFGVAINVGNITNEVPYGARSDAGDTCVERAPSSPTPTPSPCLVKIDSAAVASISAAWTDLYCEKRRFNPAAECPPPSDNASQRLAVAGAACLAVAFGAFGFILA